MRGDIVKQVVGSRGKYTYITQYDSPNYNGFATIEGIVIHHWGIEGQRFKSVMNTLIYGNVSANYILEAGKVACLVAPGLRAWHVRNNDYQKVMKGIYDINARTIGIECRPECTAGDVETLCQLIAELWCDYGVVPLYVHSDFMNTYCAGKYNAKLPYISKRSQEIYNSIINNVEGGDNKMVLTDNEVAFVKDLFRKSVEKDCSEVLRKEWELAKKQGITDGNRPKANATREEVATMIVRAIKK